VDVEGEDYGESMAIMKGAPLTIPNMTPTDGRPTAIRETKIQISVFSVGATFFRYSPPASLA
jgi:hypothetical protein